MQVLNFTEGGKTKTVERRLAINCLACFTSLDCPADVDFWFWVKSPEAEAFRTEHAAHGNARTVGAQIETLERE